MRTVRLIAFGITAAWVPMLSDASMAQQRPDERVVELARALDARLTVWKTEGGRVIHARHCRSVRQGCRARIVTFAQWMVEVADDNRIDPFLLAAMAMRESGLDPFAEGGVGELGLIQLHPRGVGRGVKFVRSEAYRRHCRATPGACQREVLEAGARLVARCIEQCGGVAAGLGAYNSGHCGENAYARRVLREQERLVGLARPSGDATRSLVD
jgi:hypothetical protein